MYYKTKEEQVQLIQQILAASDEAGDEERIPGELRGPGGGAFGRRNANLGSLSGADDAVYREYHRRSGNYALNNPLGKHPLFKKFRSK